MHHYLHFMDKEKDVPRVKTSAQGHLVCKRQSLEFELDEGSVCTSGLHIAQIEKEIVKHIPSPSIILAGK